MRSNGEVLAEREEIERIAKTVIGCAFKIQNVLGAGFLEKVYENALAHELRKAGLRVEAQRKVEVHYDGVAVGDYLADVLVNGLVVVEIKAVKAFDETHMAQCLNYLKATGLKLCLLMNFGKPHVDVKRIVMNL